MVTLWGEAFMGSPRGNVAHDLAPPSAAPQQTRGPRPLPLFLELLRQAALRDPELGHLALEGLRRYQSAPPPPLRRERPVVREVGGVTLRDCGGTGSVLILVPSLINPPSILDLDPESSLAEALARRHRVLLLDWGSAEGRRDLGLDDHVTQRLVPLLDGQGAVTLVGYCLGGTLALAAAARRETVAVVTLASPYRFNSYPTEARAQLARMWETSRPAAETLGFLPMEVLQAAFWQIDPARLVSKFARFAELDPASPEARRFVTLEDWANGGEPLPLPAARQMAEELFGQGKVFSPLPTCPLLHVTATGDRIVPAETAPTIGQRLSSPSGHVGMIVGRDAGHGLHAPLLTWLEGAARGG
jgi:polyhydroxyalkanoate synthase